MDLLESPALVEHTRVIAVSFGHAIGLMDYRQKLWGAKIANKPPSIDYERLTAPSEDSERAALEWLDKVVGCPAHHIVPANVFSGRVWLLLHSWCPGYT